MSTDYIKRFSFFPGGLFSETRFFLYFCFNPESQQAMKYHHGLTEYEAVAWSLATVVMGTVLMVINTLTLFTFIKTRSLRARKHVMIINLTAADPSICCYRNVIYHDLPS